MTALMRILRSFVPQGVQGAVRPPYHFLFALLAAVRYGFPSRKMTVVGVTGTKGKSSVTEMIGRTFEAAGRRTAIISTIHFVIAGKEERNMLKMTIPGRFLLQKLLADAVNAGCTHAVIEMSSEGAVQFRQRFVDMDALVFTHLTPEHIESHGSLERYQDAKLEIGRTLARSRKRPRIMIGNANDQLTERFFALAVDRTIPFSVEDIAPSTATPEGITCTIDGQRVESSLLGRFNLENIAAAVACARALGVDPSSIRNGISSLVRIPGRMERVDTGQAFPVYVDYAHTKESLEAAYAATRSPRICVLGNTGGGRDAWKRPAMAKVADEACAHVILTNEDPYDEDPVAIVDAMASAMKKKPEIIMDRREAISRACAVAEETSGSCVIITGKGTDPFIMGPRGSKTPWDDREVVRDVLVERRYRK